MRIARRDSTLSIESTDASKVVQVNLLQQRRIKPSEIMLRMRTAKFRKIGEIWKKHKNGIPLAEFVLLIAEFTDHAPEERVDLMVGCIELFSDIDINADGAVEWHELVQYITDQVARTSVKRPTEGPGATDPAYLVEQVRQQKLTQF